MAHPIPIITDAASSPQRPKDTPGSVRRLAGLRLALLAGVLLWLACPPATLWPLAWIAVAPLIVSVTRAANLRQAIWRGYLFGWAYLGPVWYWVGLTIVGWTGSPIGWAAWFGLTLILAGFYAAWGGTAWWLAQRITDSRRIVALAAAWVVMEWARTLGALTMPWAQLSYTQYRFPPVLQFADVTGAYGISFLLMLVNGAVAHWWMNRSQPGSTRRLWSTITLTCMVCIFGLARMQQTDAGMPLTVAAMQNGISSFNVPSSAAQLQVFTDLTQRASEHKPPPSLYVWAESAAPGDVLHDAYIYGFLRDLARRTHAAIITGGRISDRRVGYESNSSILFPPDGGRTARYDKQQLVPFGEFIPFRSLLDPIFGRAFDFPPDDVRSGINARPLRYEGPHAGPVALGPFICYEAMYPNYARRMTQSGATLLVTQSNDSWFQSRAAMEQHLAAVTLRAIENRRQVVRATTTGITCLIDSEGRVMQRAPRDRAAFLIGTMQRLDGRTLYTRFGDWFVLLCAALIVIAVRGLNLQDAKNAKKKLYEA